MAGGSASDVRSPYPIDEYLMEFGPFGIITNKAADFVVDKHTVPFAFKPVRCAVTAQEVVTSNVSTKPITINIEDDTGTAKSIVTDAALSVVTAGAGTNQALTVKTTGSAINAGAEVICSYGSSGAGNTGSNVKVRLWVKPVN